jgi:hypothetical protein
VISRIVLLFLAVTVVVQYRAQNAAQQDARTVLSPDGQLEFRLFVGQPEGSGLTRLAYQVLRRGKPIVGTSYLGIDIVPQEPLLGENLGLTGSSVSIGAGYNELRAQYMQNGSLGRRLDLDVRAYDSKVEFRYLVPRSTPLAEPFTIDDEKTEFAVEPEAAGMVKIGEDGAGKYPAMTLLRERGAVMVTRLDRQFEATTPLTTPWRVIGIVP